MAVAGPCWQENKDKFVYNLLQKKLAWFEKESAWFLEGSSLSNNFLSGCHWPMGKSCPCPYFKCSKTEEVWYLWYYLKLCQCKIAWIIATGKFQGEKRESSTTNSQPRTDYKHMKLWLCAWCLAALDARSPWLMQDCQWSLKGLLFSCLQQYCNTLAASLWLPHCYCCLVVQ